MPLLSHLESVYIASDETSSTRVPGAVRHPVTWFYGTTISGVRRDRGERGLPPGDPVVVMPSGVATTIRTIETADGPVDEAFPPMAVTITLDDQVGVARGDMICRPHNQPSMTQEIEATVSWMDAQHALTVGLRSWSSTRRSWSEPPSRPCTTRWTSTGCAGMSLRPSSALNDIGRIRLHTTEPLAIDDYQVNRATGSFILIDPHTNLTVGAGTVKFAAQHAPSPNVVRHTGKLTAEERYRHLGMRGATVLFTGLSGSGKSTLAAAVEELLVKRGQPAFMVDGDNLRHNLCSDLGFSPEDRAENLRRAGEVARLLAEDGTVALFSLISPCAEERRKLREVHADTGMTFFEVYVNTPLEICEQRDPKGLYAKARAGELARFHRHRCRATRRRPSRPGVDS